VLTPVRFDRLNSSLQELMRRAPRELLAAATDVSAPQATEVQQRDNIFAATRAIAATIRPPPKQPPKRKAGTLSLYDTIAAYVSGLVRLLVNDSLTSASSSAYSTNLVAHWSTLALVRQEAQQQQQGAQQQQQLSLQGLQIPPGGLPSAANAAAAATAAAIGAAAAGAGATNHLTLALQEL
jgi:hypothetical protein